MIAAIDGACKRNGKPDCYSSGVAFIQTDAGEMFYKARFETESTNQRGEINGLLLALEVAAKDERIDMDEDIIILTDSEYLHNTVAYGWVAKWAANNWQGSAGRVKNSDLWDSAYKLIKQLNRNRERIFMQWTKGHLLPYRESLVTQSLIADPSGIDLYGRISVVANRPSEKNRIAADFNFNREKHEKSELPQQLAVEWVVLNTTADCLASFVVRTADAVLTEKGEK